MIVALDFETSNTTPGDGAPIQIGAAIMDGEETLATFERVLAPPRHWKDKEKITRAYDVVSLQVTGISWKTILAGSTMRECCKDLDDFIYSNKADQLPVVAYNSPFDLAWYSDLMFLGGDWDPDTRGKWDVYPSPLIGAWHCALMLARRHYKGLPDYKLDTVAKACGLARTGLYHGALEDAVLAGLIFHHVSINSSSHGQAVSG